MSTEPSNTGNVNPEPVEPAVAVVENPAVVDTMADTMAEEYIRNEVAKTKTSLQRTRIVSVVLTLLLLGYLGYITSTLNHVLEPKVAAEVANGLIAQQVEAHANELSSQMKERVPTLIADLPDYAIKQMPEYRQALEERVEQDMNQEFATAADQLGKNLDEFLEAHKDNVNAALEAGGDKEAVAAMGDDLEKQFQELLNTKPTDHPESIQDKLDKSLAMLKEVEKKMTRLANAKDLTPQEKKTRRAIAIMTSAIETKRAAEPGIGMGTGTMGTGTMSGGSNSGGAAAEAPGTGI